jgi:hypothetical protein
MVHLIAALVYMPLVAVIVAIAYEAYSNIKG